jgi:predicted small secreted protein
MKSKSAAVEVLLIVAALTMSGCGATMDSAGRAGTAAADSGRDYRGDFGGSRYPGPPLTGGGN